MRRSIVIVLVLCMLSVATLAYVSNSSTKSELNSTKVETDKIVIAIVKSLNDNAKKNSSVTNFSATYDDSQTATVNYTFSNTIKNESGTVSYKIKRFNSITEANKFTDNSSAGFTKLPIALNDLLLRNYVKAAKREPRVSVLLVKFQYSPPEENLLVQFDDVVILGNIKISYADFGASITPV
jgi:hypothetical protein